MMLILFVLLLVIVCLIIIAAPPAGRNWAVLLLAGLAFVLVAIQAAKLLTG
jgi:hypothetical protein